MGIFSSSSYTAQQYITESNHIEQEAVDAQKNGQFELAAQLINEANFYRTKATELGISTLYVPPLITVQTYPWLSNPFAVGILGRPIYRSGWGESFGFKNGEFRGYRHVDEKKIWQRPQELERPRDLQRQEIKRPQELKRQEIKRPQELQRQEIKRTGRR